MNSPVALVDAGGFKPTILEGVAMLMHNYGDLDNTSLPGGWNYLRDYTGIENFKATLYYRSIDGVTEYSIAFQGTIDIWGWKNNLDQLLGISIHNYEALSATRKVRKAIGTSELTALGHSKGGAQAALVSKKFNIYGMTFNAAGLSTFTCMLYNAFGEFNVDAYMMSSDPLSLIQNQDMNDIIPNTDGNLHFIPPFDNNSLLNGHALINFYNYFKSK